MSRVRKCVNTLLPDLLFFVQLSCNWITYFGLGIICTKDKIEPGMASELLFTKL